MLSVFITVAFSPVHTAGLPGAVNPLTYDQFWSQESYEPKMLDTHDSSKLSFLLLPNEDLKLSAGSCEAYQ